MYQSIWNFNILPLPPSDPPVRGISHFQFWFANFPFPWCSNVLTWGHTKRANAPNPQNSTKMPLEATSSNSPCPCDMVSNSSYSSLLSYFHSHGRISKSNTRSFPLAAMHVEVVPIWNAVAYAFFVPAPSPQRNFFCTINFFIYLCLCSCHNRLDQSRIHHLPLSPQFVVYLCTIDLGSSLVNLFWYWKINFEIKGAVSRGFCCFRSILC